MAITENKGRFQYLIDNYDTYGLTNHQGKPQKVPEGSTGVIIFPGILAEQLKASTLKCHGRHDNNEQDLKRINSVEKLN